MRARGTFRPPHLSLWILWTAVHVAVLTVPQAKASELDILLFGSLDGGAGTFFSAGAKLAPSSLSASGPLALLGVGSGMRAERTACGCGGNRTLALKAASSGMIGYQWVFASGIVAVFVGGESAFERRDATRPEVRTGLRIQAETWLRPTDATLVEATAIAATARRDVWTRLAWGYRMWDVYFGPEGGVYADRTGYRKFSAGLHATDFALAKMRFRLSTGLQWETGRRSPLPYVGLSAWAPL